MGFVTSTQNQNNFKDAPVFHRVKKVVIHFTDNDKGGFGRSKAYYKKEFFEITLKDQPGIQLVYFYEPIFCKGFKVELMDIYPGVQNELHLNEIIVYHQK